MELAAPGPLADQAEVLFLLVQALHATPGFAGLAAAVAESAAAQHLLPGRHDVHGNVHTLRFGELQQRFAHLPPNALQLLLSQLLERRRAEAPQPAARGLTSLLEPAALSVLADASGPSVASPTSRPPAWLRPGRLQPSDPHRLLLLRPAGLLRSAQHPAAIQPQQAYARQLAHALTVRGHRYAVYCLACDRNGRYLVTGSDDRLVKVWSTTTGLLQATCRGHDAEITDLSVSADNALVASSSMDGTVRVWQLEGGSGRPGVPVSVLVGHDGPTAFVDFHPTHPDALLSASFDGTCRIWRARDAAAPPLVLTVDPARFGLSGHAMTRLGGLGWPGPAAARAAAADVNGLDAGLGVRTTRNMERQLQGLLGDGSAGASGATGHGPSGSQPQQGATRQSGRARQRRDLSEAAIEEARRRQWDAVFSDNGVAEAEGEDEEAEGADAGGEGGAGGGSTGLLVCGFSRDGTHIVAGGNDCSVYVWQWEVPPAADAAQQQQQRAASLPGKGSSRSAVTGALAGQATAAAAALPTGLEAAGQLQAEGGACEPAAMETTPEAAAVEAAGPSAAAQPLGGSLLADPPAADERQQHAQPLPAVQQQGQQGGRQAQRQRVAGAAYPASPLGAEDAPWPAPKEVCQLKGHRNDVILLQFSHAGDRAATGSKDGSVRVWRRPRRWRKRAQGWEQEVTFAVLPDPEAIKEARRRRRPPPAPSVDQIAWSADDQLLCVSITDYGIRVLAMPSGEVLHNLSIHTNHVHVLECHPTDPALAFSASYDGTVAVWDMRSGQVLRRFSSRQTRPDGRSWPDLIPLSDGHFSPDGRSITVTDVAGQLHHYALGPRCDLLGRAPYDQFLTNDYGALMRDLQHNVVDAETQLAPHLAPGLLCDALGNPYPEGLQAAYRTRRVLAAPAEDAAWLEPGKEPGYLLAAPTLTAAAWAVEQANGTDHAVQLAIARAQERLTVHEDRLDAGASAAAAREAAAAAGAPAPRRRQRGGVAWAAAEEEVAAMDEVVEPESSGDMYTDSRDGADSDEDVDSALLTSEEEDEDYEEDNQEGRRGRRGRQAAVEASRQSSRLAGRRTAGRAAGGAAGTRRSGAAAPAAAAEPEGQREEREERQRADREARAARRRAAQQERLAEERHRRQRAAAARRRRSAADSSDEEAEISELSEEEAGPSRRAAAAQPRASRRRGRAEMEADEGAGASQPAAGEDGRQRKRQRHGGWRELVNYSWLLVSEQTPGVYVPQAGDSVVYLRQGHERFLTATNDKRPPPWQALRGGRAMRPAEPCTVVKVEYVIANDGSDHTLAQLTLSLADEASPLRDTCFVVEVPPPIAGHPEFVVHRSRFEASLLAKCWEVGDECQTYWNEDEATGAGAWWLGRIVGDQRGGRHDDVLADPFGASDLWDRYEVEWQGKVGPDGQLVDEQAPNSNHCPWELYSPGTTHQAAMQEAPTLDAALTQRMLAAVEAASQEDRFVIFVAAPEYDEVYVSLHRRQQPYNRLVALPLSLTQLGDRLRSGYYRQPAALACDIATIASNAAAFNGADSELADDAAALAGYLSLVLQGQDPDLATYATYPEDLPAAEAEAAGPSRGRGRRARRSARRQHFEEEEGEEQMQQAAALPGLPLLDPLAGLPPIPVSELPPLPMPEAPAQHADRGQQEQQQGQQQGQPWPGGLPASTSPRAAAPLGFGGAAGRPGGGLTVRFTVPQRLRSGGAAAESAAPASAAEHAAAGAAVEGAATGATQPAAVGTSDAHAAAQPPAAAASADSRGTEPAAGMQRLPPAAAGEPAGAVEPATAAQAAAPMGPPLPAELAASPAPAAPLQNLFADVAALLCQPGDVPSLAAGPGAATAAAAAVAQVPAAAAAATAARAPPPAAWFAAPPSGWPGTGAEPEGAAGQRSLRGSGATRRQTYAELASEEEEEASSSDQGGRRRRHGRQQRNSTAVAARQQQQGGRRTTGRARQQYSYRESGSEEEEDAWGEAPAPPQRASRPRQQQRRQQDSDEDYMEEDGMEDEEEDEYAGTSGGSSDGGGAPRRRSGRQAVRRR